MRAALNRVYEYIYHTVEPGDGMIEVYASDLLGIFEQEGRSPEERDSLLHTDFEQLMWLRNELEESGEDTKHIEWLENLIIEHLENISDLGIVLEDEWIKNLPEWLKTKLGESRIGWYYFGQIELGDIQTPNGTNHEKEAFGRVILAGLLQRDGNRYKWAGRPYELGYFVDTVYPASSPKGLNEWFGYNNVAKVKNDCKNDRKLLKELRDNQSQQDSEKKRKKIIKKYHRIRNILKTN